MPTDSELHDVVTQTHAGPDPTIGGGNDRVYLLVQRLGEASVVTLAPGGTLLMGRGRECDVLLDDTKASREHCRVVRRPDGIFATDLGSRNGTWMRGQKLPTAAETPLFAGDVLSVGVIEVVVAIAPPARDMRVATEESLGLGETIVADPATVGVYRMARRIAPTPATVLLHGETGSGKEVLAEQIHGWSPRSASAFVRINCAALPEPLLESELFGHEKGSFTGADRKKQGLFAAAHQGTLLLDEIGELTAATQAKLVRAIETKRIQPLGSTTTIEVDVRILCATHRDLQAAVRDGKFREDLYYRISTFVLTLPPLRNRPAELALLCERFIQTFAERQGVRPPRMSPEAAACLKAYRWPGNVRELRNAIEHAVVMCDSPVLEKRHLPANLSQSPARRPDRTSSPLGVRDELEGVERERIARALEEHGGNRTRTAQALGISRRALIYKLHKHGLG